VHAIPEEGGRVTYTEEQIRRAFERHQGCFTIIPVSFASLMAELDHVHDFADGDTVTAKEIRDAFTRVLPDGRCRRCGSKFHGNDVPSEYFLRDISKHREKMDAA
jgi:hypothetical protein